MKAKLMASGSRTETSQRAEQSRARTLPSVVVVETFVAEVLATGQVIPARRVSVLSTSEETRDTVRSS